MRSGLLGVLVGLVWVDRQHAVGVRVCHELEVSTRCCAFAKA